MKKLVFFGSFFAATVASAQLSPDGEKLARIHAADTGKGIVQIVQNSLAGTPKDVVEVFSQQLSESVAQKYAQEYAKNLNSEELKQLVDVLSSSSGQKFRATNATLALSMATDPAWFLQVKQLACSNTQKKLTAVQMAPLLSTFCK